MRIWNGYTDNIKGINEATPADIEETGKIALHGVNPKHKFGDILSPNKTGHELFICHQANCHAIIDDGVTRYLRDAIPGWFEDYKTNCQNKNNYNDLLGTVQYYPIKHDGYDMTICNIFAKVRCSLIGKSTDFEALRKGFREIRTCATPLPARPYTTVRIPKFMGCNHNAENWKTVRQIIQEELVDHAIPVELWTPKDDIRIILTAQYSLVENKIYLQTEIVHSQGDVTHNRLSTEAEVEQIKSIVGKGFEDIYEISLERFIREYYNAENKLSDDENNDTH